MNPEPWLGFVLASAAILAGPGPTTGLAVALALSTGRPAWTVAIGAGLGDLVSVVTVTAGIGLMLLRHPEALTFLRLSGAAGLLVLGARSVHPSDAARPALLPAIRADTFLTAAFLMSALHPARLVFLACFVPQFIEPSRPLAAQLVIIPLTFATLAGLASGGWMLMAARVHADTRTRLNIRRLSDIAGPALIAAGILSGAASLWTIGQG